MHNMEWVIFTNVHIAHSGADKKLIDTLPSSKGIIITEEAWALL